MSAIFDSIFRISIPQRVLTWIIVSIIRLSSFEAVLAQPCIARSFILQPSVATMVVNVAFTICGWKSAAGKYMEQRTNSGREPWIHVPLYNLLSDPVKDEQVKHQHDCSDPLTVIAIYSQSAFAPLVIRMANDMVQRYVDGDSLLGDVECVSGFHRASTVGATVKLVLNSLLDAKGERMFNCQTFSLLQHTHKQSLAKQVDMAVEWTQKPWCTIPTVPIDDREQIWGYEQCMARPDAMKSFHDIWDWVSGHNAHTAKSEQRQQQPRKPQQASAKSNVFDAFKPQSTAGRRMFDPYNRSKAGKSSSHQSEEVVSPVDEIDAEEGVWQATDHDDDEASWTDIGIIESSL